MDLKRMWWLVFSSYTFYADFLGDKLLLLFLCRILSHLMQENEFLHRVLCFKVKEAPNGPELYVPENEKVSFRAPKLTLSI